MKLLRNTLMAAFGLVLIVFAAFQLFKPQIAQRAFDRALEQNLGRNIMTELPDGIHVFICGAGSPLSTLRAGPCTGIIAGQQAFILDAGAGSPANLRAMAFPMPAVQGVYITHLHSDHIDGLGEMMLPLWVGRGSTTPLPVYGPAGITEVVDGFNAAYRIDSTFRTAHHGTEIAPPSGFGATGNVLEIADSAEIVYDQAGVTITAIEVSHEPVLPAFAYRIDYGGRSVTVSGDTVYDQGFTDLSKGVDLMLHEALQPTMVTAMRDKARDKGISRLETIFDDILDYHASPEDAARSAQEAGASQLVLHHLVPEVPVKLLYPMFLGGAPEVYDGKITIAEDGMIFSLPAGSDDIRMRRAF